MGSFLVIASAFGFSTLAIFGKIAYQMGFHRNEMLAWRFGLSIPVLFVILVCMKALPKNRSAFLKAVALGAVGIGTESSVYFMTLAKVGAALTEVLLYLYPAFVAVISHFFLKEKMGPKKAACVVLSLVGCVFTVDLHANLQSGGDLSGVFLGALTGFLYAVYLLAGDRLLKDENPLTVGAGIVLGSFLTFGTLATAPSITTSVPARMPQHLTEWGVLAGMALCASVLPFTTLYAGMKRVGPTRASILSTFELVFAIVLAAVFLGEKLTGLQGVGAFLILLSVLLIQRLR